MVRKLVYAAAVVLAIDAAAACSADQLHDFIAWHQQDPAAATAYSRLPAIQTLLHANNPNPNGAGSSSDGPQFREYLTNRHGATWDRIAWCESGGNWHHPPVHNGYGSFSGGLMIKSDVWDHYGGGRYASDAWLATKGQQIAVAERILADVGWSAWQCS